MGCAGPCPKIGTWVAFGSGGGAPQAAVVGLDDGLGLADGEPDGLAVGEADGDGDGDAEAVDDGRTVGETVGTGVPPG